MAYEDYIDDIDFWDDKDFLAEPDVMPTYSQCPKCGGRLVERNGKHGKFYGCDKFPICTFTCSKSQYIKHDDKEEKVAKVFKQDEIDRSKPVLATGNHVMDRNLRFLELAKDFKVEKREGDGDSYMVSVNGGDLVAIIEDGAIDYCVSGVYNSGSDYATIDIEVLDRLRAFCEMLKEGDNQ